MKKNYFFIGLVSFLFATTITNAQCFRKGTLIVGISEGSTKAFYSTSDISTPKPTPVKKKCMDGVRDPLVIEYGVSNRWSIGLTSGNDIFTVNSNDFYGFSTTSNKVDVKTSELTFDVNYHFYVSKKLDLSVFSGCGAFSVAVKGNDNDNYYNYTANGNIVRVGTRARYYFYKRLGAFGMVSSYNGKSSPKDVRGNTVGNNYSTKINGFAVEMGLCYRFF